MSMKKQTLFPSTLLTLVLYSLLIFACASAPKGSDDLDRAIRDTSDYLNNNIPNGNKIVIINIQSEYNSLSEYIIDELIANAVNDKVFSVVDRAQLDAIRMELNFQLSGEVSDESALSIGKFLGAQTIVSGAISELADRHRIRIRALNVETAEVQGQYNRNITASRLIAALQKGGSYSGTSYGTRTARADTSGNTNSGNNSGSDTSGGNRQTAQARQPAGPKQGTYTFFPRPQAMQGGVDQNGYVDKIIVRSGFFVIYMTNRPRGDGRSRVGNINWSGSAWKLVDLDRPSIEFSGVQSTETQEHMIITFEKITGSRFSLTFEAYSEPYATYEEINLDDAEYEP